MDLTTATTTATTSAAVSAGVKITCDIFGGLIKIFFKAY